MNEHDRQNLEFLMSLRTAKDWAAWAENCDDDDMQYALDLVKTAKAEADVKLMEMDEAEQDEDGLDCTLANEFINRVKKESL